MLERSPHYLPRSSTFFATLPSLIPSRRILQHGLRQHERNSTHPRTFQTYPPSPLRNLSYWLDLTTRDIFLPTMPIGTRDRLPSRMGTIHKCYFRRRRNRSRKNFRTNGKMSLGLEKSQSHIQSIPRSATSNDPR
jgi:hypothetical protein